MSRLSYAQWTEDPDEIWTKVYHGVNRTMQYVDRKLEEDIDWLHQKDCDLNDIEQNILSAFNVDVRRSAVESTAITIYYRQ